MSRPLLVWLLLSMIWGSTWLFIKLGLDDLPPFTFAGIRFVIGVVPLLILMAARKSPLPKDAKDWQLIAVTGLLTFTVNYGLIFWSENYISSGLAAILYTTTPLFGLVIAHFYLKAEQMTLLKLAGVVTGIAGTALIFSHEVRLENAYAVWGAGAIVLSALATAYAGILIKGQGTHLDPLVLTSGQMIIGFMPLLAVGLPLEGNPLTYHWTPMAIVALLYLAFVGSSLTFVLLYWLIQRMDVTKTQLIPFASTLIAVALGRLVLNEQLNWRTTIGALAILSGLAMTNFRWKRSGKPTADRATVSS